MLKKLSDWVDSDSYEFTPIGCILIAFSCLISYIFIPIAVTKFYLQDIVVHPWSIFSYIFAHADERHIYGNMLFLCLFGYHVEKALGIKAFLKLFFFCGAWAVIGNAMFFPYSSLVGASGAVAGIMAVTPLTIKNRLFRYSILAIVCFFIYSQFMMLLTVDYGDTAVMCHICGAFAGLYWYSKNSSSLSI